MLAANEIRPLSKIYLIASMTAKKLLRGTTEIVAPRNRERVFIVNLVCCLSLLILDLGQSGENLLRVLSPVEFAACVLCFSFPSCDRG